MAMTRTNTLLLGASGGIGRAVAKRLLGTGHHLFASGRNQKVLDALQNEHPGQITVWPHDLRKPKDVRRLCQRVDGAAHPITHLVAASGMIRRELTAHLTEEDLNEHLRVNVTSPVMVAIALATRVKRERRHGSVTFLSSTLGLHPASGTMAYACAKAALITAAKTMALEWAPDVRINTVAPGIVRTAMTESIDPETVQAMHPMGRAGLPDEVAMAVQHLMDAPWTTGTTMIVDGGLTAGFSE